MNSAKNLLIVALALTTVGGAALAWHQYQELVTLRASALADNDRAALQKKIWDLQKANRELSDELAAARTGRADSGDDIMAQATDRTSGGDNRGRRDFRGRGGQEFAAIREAMNKPEVQALMSSAQKALLDARYAALFRNLNLNADQAAKLTQLLADRQTARQDVFAAAREQGVNPRTDPTGFQKLVSDAESPINDSIKSLLGDSGYTQLANYDQTMPQRNVVNALQQRLSDTGAPLSATQADQLVQILAQTSPTPTTNSPFADGGGFGPRGGGDFMGRMGGLGGGMGGGIAAVAGPGAAQITPEAVSQAGTVLNTTQVNALQQLQQQQQTAQQLQQVIRNTWQQAEAANGSGTATGSTAGGTTTGSGSGSPASTGGRRRGGG